MKTGTVSTPKVIDLSARLAQQREALGQPAAFHLLGIDITLPPMGAVPVETVMAITEGRFDAFAELLGDAWPKLLAAGLCMSDLEVLAEAWSESQGTSPGESPASSDS